MKFETKGALHNVMDVALVNYRKAMDDVAKIHAEKDVTEEAKIRRANEVADDLMASFKGLLNMLDVAVDRAVKSLELARTANSAGRLNDNEYQSRLLGEVALINKLPDTIGHDEIAPRLAIFFGDEMAATVLKAALESVNTNRGIRGLVGFDVDGLFPDVYGLQLAMLEKIRKEIAYIIQRIASDFATGGNAVVTSKNEMALMFAEGTFKGIGVYIDQLPEYVKHKFGTGMKSTDIPAFANDAGDLDIIFGMYRG